MLRLNNFMNVVETARIAECESEDMQRIDDKVKRRDVTEVPRRGDFSRAENRRRTMPDVRTPTIVCDKCGKLHVGQCRWAANTCFKCGKAELMIKDCPLL